MRVAGNTRTDAQGAGQATPARVDRPWLQRVAPLIGVAIFLVVWQVVSLGYPAFILPGPVMVAERMWQRAADGSLIVHSLTTLGEALLGLLFGAATGMLFGYLVAKSRVADRILSPLIVASQGIPIVAIAPLLFIWFGSGLLTKVLVCALVVFFPVTVNVVAGLRGIPRLWRDLFRSLSASRWELFTKLEWPAALPMILAGLRIGATLSVIGAIVGEFLSANSGLGYLVKLGTGLYDTPLVMMGVVMIMLIALGLYASVRLLERVAIK